MNKELIIENGDKSYKVFFQSGFFFSDTPTPFLHMHKFPEIHVVGGGKATFKIGEQLYKLHCGDIMIIPANTSHGCVSTEVEIKHAAFQIDAPVKDVKICSVGGGTVSEFIRQLPRNKNVENYSIVESYVRLFCSYICFNDCCELSDITDYGFLIDEFFSHGYCENLHLRDLAEILHLSERQTQRIVTERTGRTFREQLTAVRMDIAQRLLDTTAMTLREISEYVGYGTYAGFWKAAINAGLLSDKNKKEQE